MLGLFVLLRQNRVSWLLNELNVDGLVVHVDLGSLACWESLGHRGTHLLETWLTGHGHRVSGLESLLVHKGLHWWMCHKAHISGVWRITVELP